MFVDHHSFLDIVTKLLTYNKKLSGGSMKKLTMIFAVLIGVALISATAWAGGATTVTSATSGNWNDGATWVGGAVPGTSDAVIIATGTTVTLTANVNQSGIVTVNSGGVLVLNATLGIKNNSNPGMVIDGTVDVTDNNFLNKNGAGNNPTVQVNSGGLIKLSTTSASVGVSLWTLNTGSTIEYSAAGAQTLDNSFNVAYSNLTLSGSGAKSLGANTTVNGTLSMQGTATFNLNTHTLTYGASASLEYRGSSGQTSGSEFPSTMAPGQTVIINNGNGVTLGAAKTINGTLTLTAGQLITGSYNVSVTNTAAGAVAITSGSVNGQIVRSLPAGATGTYLFTDANTSLAPTSNASAITVSVTSFPNTSIPEGDASKAIKRYYTISPSGALTATLRMAYLDGELNGLNENIFSAWRYNGSAWVDMGGSPSPASNYVEVSSISTWSDWTIAEAGGALPIQMASFVANVVRNNQVEVAWRTVSETNNYGFEIYRKRGDAGEWAKVAFVEGHGTTLAPQSYTYVDAGLSFGKYTYRIKQVDLDGKSETFPEMSVTVGVAPDKMVLEQNYPNPFNPSTLIEFVVPMSGHATMKVYNVLGQEVMTLFEGNAEAGKINTARFNASNLPSGLYFYTLSSAGQTETKRMLLTK
jgi:hypothetical protein